MIDFRFPICPICKQEVLLPFSISQSELGEKTFGNWVCSNCGFYLTTKDTRAVNPENDVEAGFTQLLKKKVEELRKGYYKKKSKE